MRLSDGAEAVSEKADSQWRYREDPALAQIARGNRRPREQVLCASVWLAASPMTNRARAIATICASCRHRGRRAAREDFARYRVGGIGAHQSARGNRVGACSPGSDEHRTCRSGWRGNPKHRRWGRQALGFRLRRNPRPRSAKLWFAVPCVLLDAHA